jgi:predicted transcriptional regulator
MTALTIRLPETLQTRLKQSAEQNHRSINKQAVVLLEQALGAPTATTAVPQDVIERRMAALMAIGQSFSALQVVDPRSDDEIMGYDNFGLPT